uniref:HORMA domain-containing protein n=1 Tax=Panagrolaimus sp. JU765 TaxID=591449 RepID=A0AC34Q493_9BILA
MAVSSWNKNFPEDPSDDPGKFFHRLSIFALSTYCHVRKMMPPTTFTFRNIEGMQIPVFNKATEVGNVFWDALISLAETFQNKKIESIQFYFYGNSKLIEIFKMSYDYDIVKSIHTPSGTDSTTDISEADSVNKAREQIKEAFFKELDNLYKLCDGLPKILKKDFPLSFRFLVNVERDSTNLKGFCRASEDSLNDVGDDFYHNDTVSRFDLAETGECKVSIATTKLKAKGHPKKSRAGFTVTIQNSESSFTIDE